MHLLHCLPPTFSLPPKAVQSNGIAHESYQQSGYNNTAADDYGHDSTMSPTSQADEMPTWDDWDDMNQHRTMTGLLALDRDLVQVVGAQETLPGKMTHVSGVHIVDQQWGMGGVEWGGAHNHCHCITDSAIQHDILLCWLTCTLAPLPSPPLPSGE